MKQLVPGLESPTPAERAAFGILSSFALTIGTARAVNYFREQRRRGAPALRDWVRRAYYAPGREQVRVHHFVPGIALAFSAGAAAIMKRDDGLEFWLGVVFGTGSGLTLDEIAILTELDNPYWESEGLALAQAAIAALGAIGLAFRARSRGKTAATRLAEVQDTATT